MYFDTSEELNRYIADRSGGVAVLAFSTGKDSIGAWLEMKKYFTRIVPVYMYTAPRLEFIEKSLNYYEDFFETKIIRLPNPSLYRMINALVLQAPENCAIIEDFNFPEFDHDFIHEVVKSDYGLSLESTFTGTGVRARDSLNRWASIKKYGPVNENRKSFFPIFDWDKARLVRELEASKVKLPIDYQLFGRTFDGIDYRFTKPLKERYPEDYERLEAFFPLIGADIFRIECRQAYFERKAKARQ